MSRVCVVVADGGRARFFVDEPPRKEPGSPSRGSRLVESETLTNPEGLMKGRDLFSDMRTGRSRGNPGPSHAHDDHRDAHLLEIERRFAGQITEAIVAFVRRQRAAKVVLAAEPRMLGLLRPLLRDVMPSAIDLVELPSDFSWHEPTRIRDALVKHQVL